MSTRRKNSKQSLQVKVTSRVNIRPDDSARYRLINLGNINTGQECRRHVDDLATQGTVRDAIVKASS